MMLLKKPLPVILLVIASLALVALYSVRVIKQGAEAYIYGYPLVLMELTRQTMGADAEPDKGPNHLYHMRSFPDHTFRNVVRPNNDTLYSISWLDLSQEPMIIKTPASDRYYVLPFMDAWTNVFASIGTRTTGNEAGAYALVGPNWSGEIPVGVKEIKSPTNMVWMIGRVQTNGRNDIPNAAAIQDQFSITPISQWAASIQNPPTIITNMKTSGKANPKQLIDELSTTEFFTMLSKLMAAQPPSPSDNKAVENLSNIGMTPGQPFVLDDLGPLQRKLVVKGVAIANRKLHEAIDSKEESPKENGWIVWRDSIGDYGTNYKLRAGVALAGLGALLPAEAVYPSTNIDSKGQHLVGTNNYKIHFPTTPPNDAFWSITMYDTEGFMIENPINRYLIGDRNKLQFNSDGSLDIYIQHNQPEAGISNWLPAPAENFVITMRIYQPTEEFIKGDWKVPAVLRIN